MSACRFCTDGDGGCVYPYYGLAPHVHKGQVMIGSTEILPRSEWPENFKEDPEWEGCGTYLWCLKCGAGKENR